MIIKVKSDELKTDEIMGTLISKKKGKYVFRIESTLLYDIIVYLHEIGIMKLKVEIEEEDNLKEQKHPIVLKEKPTCMEYYEFILRDYIPILEKEKDLDKFFNLIGFVDKCDIYKNMYERLCQITAEEEKVWAKHNFGNKTGLYYNSYRELYGDKKETDYEEIMKSSLKNWLLRYYPDYRTYFRNGLSYISFLRFLLKHTDRKYF
ncbi:MAG: hypothetical protein Q4D02_01050 [Clostridia bacterium]|nr:hypothetical protein [Clostridia bacterium]